MKSDYFSREADDLKADMQQLAPRVKLPCAYCERCYVRIQSKSVAKNILDFSDYEHFALQILTNEDGSPSEIAESYRQHFKKYWSMSIKIRTEFKRNILHQNG